MKLEKMVCPACERFDEHICKLKPEHYRIEAPQRHWCSEGLWRENEYLLTREEASDFAEADPKRTRDLAWAIRILGEGGVVRRKAWPLKQRLIIDYGLTLFVDHERRKWVPEEKDLFATDWETYHYVDPNLRDFKWARKQMKAGQAVRRSWWTDSDLRITLNQEGRGYEKRDTTGVIGEPSWQVPADDFIAMDWEVYKPPTLIFNYEMARKKMILDGLKVRRALWRGTSYRKYLEYHPSTGLTLTREDGESVFNWAASPHDKIANDWEIYEEPETKTQPSGCEFKWAIDCMEEGKRVRRIAWPPREHLLAAEDRFTLIKDGITLENYWRPTPKDLHAGDWIIYETSPPPSRDG